MGSRADGMTPFDPGAALRLAFALRLAIIALTLLTARRTALGRLVAFCGSVAASLVTAGSAAAMLQAGASRRGELFVHRASQFALTYAVDGLSAWFLIVLSTLAIPIAIFSIGYFANGHFARRSAFVGAAFNVLVGAVELVFVASDAITFLFAWELMTLTAAALVTTEHEERDNRRAAYLYLVMSHVATGCLIAGFLVLASASGSIMFSTLLSGDAGARADPRRALRTVLRRVRRQGRRHPPARVAAGGASGGADQHLRPDVRRAHQGRHLRHRARLRFRLGSAAAVLGRARRRLGGLSAVLGVLYALMQHDLKRLLAYHSIENIGIILLGLGAGMMALAYGRGELAWIGVAASLYHVLESRRLQGPAVSRRRRRGDDHRDAAD